LHFSAYSLRQILIPQQCWFWCQSRSGLGSGLASKECLRCRSGSESGKVMQIPPDQVPDLHHCHNVYFVLPAAILVSIYTEKRPRANQLLLLQINDSHGKLSTDTIDNISIAYAYTRPSDNGRSMWWLSLDMLFKSCREWVFKLK